MAAPILVGVDGSDHSLAAAGFAAGEARMRDRELVVYHAYVIPAVVPSINVLHGDPQFFERLNQEQRAAAERIVAEAVKHVNQHHPEVSVTGEAADGFTVSSSIIDRATSCELVVLGGRGRGGFAGLLLGSTSAQVATHATRPVIVMRPDQVDTGPDRDAVVVGVEDTSSAQAAMAFAFDEADRRGAMLVAVHVYRRARASRAALPEAEARVLAEAIAGWREQYPDVSVEMVYKPGRPREVLNDVSIGATMLVVGSRGRGGFTGMLLGSTSLAMIHHAGVPVAVIR